MENLRRLWHVILAIQGGMGKHHTTTLSASIAYFALFSLLPLCLGLVSLLSFLISPESAQAAILQVIGTAVPSQVSFVHDTLHSLVKARGVIGGIAIVSLIWGAQGLFLTLADSLDVLWEVPSPDFKEGLIRNGISLLCTIGLGGLAAVAWLLYGAMALLSRSSLAFPDWFVGWWNDDVIPALLVLLAFLVAYRFLGRRRFDWRALGIGALVATGLWELTRWLFGFYLAHVGIATFYGPVSSIFIFLVWLQFTGMLFALGAETIHATHDAYFATPTKARSGGDTPPSPRHHEKSSDEAEREERHGSEGAA